MTVNAGRICLPRAHDICALSGRSDHVGRLSLAVCGVEARDSVEAQHVRACYARELRRAHKSPTIPAWHAGWCAMRWCVLPVRKGRHWPCVGSSTPSRWPVQRGFGRRMHACPLACDLRHRDSVESAGCHTCHTHPCHKGRSGSGQLSVTAASRLGSFPTRAFGHRLVRIRPLMRVDGERCSIHSCSGSWVDVVRPPCGRPESGDPHPP